MTREGLRYGYLLFIGFSETGLIDYNYPVIAFGNYEQLNVLFKNLSHLNYGKIIVVPLDSSQIDGKHP